MRRMTIALLAGTLALGGVGLALQEQDCPEVQVLNRPVGSEFKGLAKCGLGLRVAVDSQQRAAEGVVGSRSQRIALDALVYQVDRFAKASDG